MYGNIQSVLEMTSLIGKASHTGSQAAVAPNTLRRNHVGEYADHVKRLLIVLRPDFLTYGIMSEAREIIDTVLVLENENQMLEVLHEELVRMIDKEESHGS